MAPEHVALAVEDLIARTPARRGRLFGGGFEGVGRESRGGGLLGRVLPIRRVVAEAFECVSPLRLDGASRMVGRRLACRDAASSRARHLTREIVPQPARSSLNPRARHSGRRARGLSDVLGGYPAISRTAAPGAAAPRASRCAFRPRERRLDGGPTAHKWSRENAAMRPLNNLRGDSPRGATGGAGCPDLLQRPESHWDAGGESLIFRASARRRSRPGAPLQQIWTRPRPGPPQESHTHHTAPAHPHHHDDPDPRARRSRRERLGEG